VSVIKKKLKDFKFPALPAKKVLLPTLITLL